MLGTVVRVAAVLCCVVSVGVGVRTVGGSEEFQPLVGYQVCAHNNAYCSVVFCPTCV
jgi:hypothetical protein